MKTSAPATASFREPVTPPGLVCSAIQPRLLPGVVAMSGRPPCTTPCESQTTTSVAPASSSSLRIAVPAAPAPVITIADVG